MSLFRSFIIFFIVMSFASCIRFTNLEKSDTDSGTMNDGGFNDSSIIDVGTHESDIAPDGDIDVIRAFDSTTIDSSISDVGIMDSHLGDCCSNDVGIMDSGRNDGSSNDSSITDSSAFDVSVEWDGDIDATSLCLENYVTANALRELLLEVVLVMSGTGYLYHPIDDDYSEGLRLFRGQLFLDTAPNETIDWVNGEPSAMIIFSINAPEGEDPVTGDGMWESTGLLIRGATVNFDRDGVHGNDRLCAIREIDLEDMNLVDVSAPSSFEFEYAGPEDSEIAEQLIDATNAIKAVVAEAISW